MTLIDEDTNSILTYDDKGNPSGILSKTRHLSSASLGNFGELFESLVATLNKHFPSNKYNNHAYYALRRRANKVGGPLLEV